MAKRTLEVEDDAAVLVLTKDGGLTLDLKPQPNEAVVPPHVMLVSALAVCIANRPGWVTEAVEWMVDKKDSRNVGAQG